MFVTLGIAFMIVAHLTLYRFDLAELEKAEKKRFSNELAAAIENHMPQTWISYGRTGLNHMETHLWDHQIWTLIECLFTLCHPYHKHKGGECYSKIVTKNQNGWRQRTEKIKLIMNSIPIGRQATRQKTNEGWWTPKVPMWRRSAWYVFEIRI